MFDYRDAEPLAVGTTGSFSTAIQDYHTPGLSLDRTLIRNPSATFCLRLTSDSLSTLGLHSGDEVLVDRSRSPEIGKVCVVTHDGEYRIGVLARQGSRTVLRSELETIPLTPADLLFGVVTIGIVHLDRP